MGYITQPKQTAGGDSTPLKVITVGTTAPFSITENGRYVYKARSANRVDWTLPTDGSVTFVQIELPLVGAGGRVRVNGSTTFNRGELVQGSLEGGSWVFSRVSGFFDQPFLDYPPSLTGTIKIENDTASAQDISENSVIFLDETDVDDFYFIGKASHPYLIVPPVSGTTKNVIFQVYFLFNGTRSDRGKVTIETPDRPFYIYPSHSSASTTGTTYIYCPWSGKEERVNIGSPAADVTVAGLTTKEDLWPDDSPWTLIDTNLDSNGELTVTPAPAPYVTTSFAQITGTLEEGVYEMEYQITDLTDDSSSKPSYVFTFSDTDGDFNPVSDLYITGSPLHETDDEEVTTGKLTIKVDSIGISHLMLSGTIFEAGRVYRAPTNINSGDHFNFIRILAASGAAIKFKPLSLKKVL